MICAAFTRGARQINVKVGRRFLSSAATKDLVTTQIDEASAIATVTMQNAPVNALSLEMLQALSSSIQTVDANPKVQGLTLQSSVPKIFSSGLDIMEMHNPDEARLIEFWKSFQQLYFDLYGSRLACIAAIDGHAPAAGCMLALSCDYRIMKEKSNFNIGLNESKLGIVAPPWLGQQMMDTVGRRRAEIALSLGLLYNPQQALEIELVDEIVGDVQARATERAKEWVAIPPNARVLSKMLLRKERLDTLKANTQEDIDNFLGIILNETTQKNISAYLQMLAAKKSKKK